MNKRATEKWLKQMEAKYLTAKETPSGGSERRLVRVAWTADEDAEITGSYGGDWIVTYPMQAARLNSKFHNGSPVRSARSVERRERKIESDANAPAVAPPTLDSALPKDVPGG